MVNTFEQLLELTNEKGQLISQVAIEQYIQESETTQAQTIEKMQDVLEIMLASVEAGCNSSMPSSSGLSGTNASKMKEHIGNNKAICGSLISNAITMALGVSELNAKMGKIVASPTAGSCGILPAAIISLMQEKEISKDRVVLSLFTAGQVGLIIAKNASISGSECGCQAECGTAAAMAAAAIVELCGGTPEMSIHAAAIAIKCILGLVCDPVAGLVEVPCVKRNASGVTLAFTAAEMALAGITSMIKPDEVVSTMKKVGDALPCALKETAQGGLAATMSARKIQNDVFNKLYNSCMTKN